MKVDPTNPAQNAFVQDWLEAWRDKYLKDEDEILAIEVTIELVQETYRFESLEVAWYTLRSLHAILKDKAPDIAGQIELTGAFCKATAQQQGESWANS